MDKFWKDRGRKMVCSVLLLPKHTKLTCSETVQRKLKFKQPFFFVLDHNNNSNSKPGIDWSAYMHVC